MIRGDIFQVRRKMKFLLLLATICCFQFSWSQIYFDSKIKHEAPSEQNYFGDALDSYENYIVSTCIHCENPKAWNGGLLSLWKVYKDSITLIANMYPDSSANKDRFGQDAVAIHKDKIVVGDWSNKGGDYGVAHVFAYSSDGSWKHEQKLSVPNNSKVKHFGQRVDIDGEFIVVSAWSTVYVFKFDGDSYQFFQQLSKEEEGFGSEIIIKDNLLVIGAPYKDENGLENSGVVYVYELGSLQFKLIQVISGHTFQQEGLEYGEVLAYNKGTLYVGVPEIDMEVFSGAGAVHVYKIKDGKFVYKQEIYADDMKYNKYRFGEKLSISDSLLVIGEAQDEEHHGSVYIYLISDEEYKFLGKVISPVSSYYGNDFGQNGIAISNTKIYVGAPGDDYCNSDKEWGRGGCGSILAYNVDFPAKKIEQLYTIEEIQDKELVKIMKRLNGDRLVYDRVNEDGVVIIRHKETNKWGMYQMNEEIIPMRFDSINFFGWNDPITKVMNDGKWGIVSYDKEDAGLKCIYDDIRIYTFEGAFLTAGKRDGLWRCVDWRTGTENNTQVVKYHQQLRVPRDSKY